MLPHDYECLYESVDRSNACRVLCTCQLCQRLLCMQTAPTILLIWLCMCVSAWSREGAVGLGGDGAAAAGAGSSINLDSGGAALC